MRVRDLPLSTAVIDHFESQGITELYPPQAAAVEAGVCEGRRLVAAVPTASGKTFVATLAMLTADGPGLYIVPLRALAREKYETFSDLPGVSVGISTGDFDSSAAELANNDIVVATSEKVDSAIRNGADWITDLSCVAVDEVHLVGSEGRGPTLEVTLATLGRRAPGVQIVALSATVANPDELADWLDAGLVQSTWRPVDLRTGVYAADDVTFDSEASKTPRAAGEAGDDGTERRLPIPGDPDDATDATDALVAEVVDEGGQALAFVRSRREAETLAERLSGVGAAPDVADEIRDLDDTETGRRLADCIEGGVAFHHAGLRSAHRIAVERAFRDRRLRAICATPTLAAGVNVPARRVVVRDQKRYTGSGTEWLPTLEVHQMCGRAGRPGLDPYGEAILVGDETTREELWERYVDAEPERVESQLADPNALRTHVLSVVASDFAASREGVLDVLDATFFAHGTPTSDLGGVVDTAVADLVAMGMIVDNDGLAATDLGAQVSRQYVTPETGARIVDGLRTAADVEATGLTALEIICDTPDMQDTYLGNRERADMYQFAQDHADEFTTRMGETDDFEGWLTAVKTARVLHEWTEGASAEELVERFRIGPGDLESRIERAEWLLGAADAIAGVVDAGAAVPFRARRARL